MIAVGHHLLTVTQTVLDVYELENARGVVVSMGGQIPNNMASQLDRQNVRIFGTDASMIDGYGWPVLIGCD